jgi:GAF domain-containing protein
MYTEPTRQEKAANPRWLTEQARALLAGQTDAVANAANLSALIYLAMEDVNWAGFYFYRDGRLLVGPFQGRPACVEIPLGKGVCGTAAETREVQRVADVHAFDGHIACDVDSRSEIVLPLVRNGELIGVLDIDSPVPDRFGPEEEALLRDLVEIYIQSVSSDQVDSS